MVYKRYVKLEGKSYGPYYYASIRKGKKVVSVFLGKTLKQAKQTLGRLRELNRKSKKRGANKRR